VNETQYMDPIPSRLNKASVEQIASFVAKKLDFSIGDPIEPIVEELGGKIKIGWNHSDEKDGGSIIASALDDFVIHISELTSSRRDRFTIAHELGHLILHLREIHKDAPDAIMRATRSIDDTDEDQQRAEWEANWFAAELLMPRKKFKKVVEKHGKGYAASLFNVSPMAAKVRAESV